MTNGVYQTGGRVVAGALTNRVAVNKPVTVQSVNGPAVTVIRGFQVPGTTNGDSAIRCVYLTNGAALVGFTLTNEATRSLGGDEEVWRARIGGGVSCESASATVSNCTLSGSSADLGGGAYISTMNNCTLNGNSASVGGWRAAGGAYESMLNNCKLTANSSNEGGGVAGGTLNNCTLSGNSANEGGGAFNSTLNNCIVYYNSAPNGDNYNYYSRLSYSWTTPLPPEGVGNISAAPQLADLSHLSAGSPCRGAGSAAYATGLDIDGEPWANPPSIGCEEYHPGAVTGPLSVSIQAAYTNVAAGITVNFTATIDGRATANRWDFGDGTVVSNRPYASHSWAVTGDYLVVFKAYNDTYLGGISTTVRVHVMEQPVHYVALSSVNPVAPYTSWATAANNIQDVVDAASVAGALVLVTNGVYQTGGRMASEADAITNRVAVTKALIVRSVNGAALTVIQGYRDPASTYGSSGVRCVYLANGAALVGFTLINGAAGYGGGVWCESAGAIVSNCVLTGNSAYLGGGASGGTLNNCTLSGNSSSYGGGADCSMINNCNLTDNLATNTGGGAVNSTLNNCIVYYNTALSGDNYSESSLNYSCTTPLPTNGIANLTNAPLFLDYAGGDLRLQSNSPCINAGNNADAPAGPDLAGNPRIAGGTVDIGAYEFQSPQSHISYAWLQQYGLPTDGSADYTDTDGDGMNNWQEWRCGTSPTDANSALRLLSAQGTGTNVILAWQSVAGVNYFLERGMNLGASVPFTPLATNLPGQPGTTAYTDISAAGASPLFYRVGVGN